ncbi:UDP-glucose 4-epimerase GalE [Kiloniella sp.]|uniref:UDP-glucose 4-epimerase GalE n=1 Tax=Kiloniella sp. TaxID=1938587 RepID=UPI003A90075B
MKRILVTGGAGFIGSHAAMLLKEGGYLPVVYDNLSTGHRNAVKWGPLEIGDLGDSERLLDVMIAYKPQAVFHFAAKCLVNESMENPLDYYQQNVSETISLLKVMKKVGCHQMVFSSSCATYGDANLDTITEDLPQNPINPYGRSKLMVESILKDAEKEFPLKSVSLRYFNAAGADPSSRIGEDHRPETHIIPVVLQCAFGSTDIIHIFGDDYATKDGTCVRDFVHVVDIARAHILALKWLETGQNSEQFNLGLGEGYSILDIIKVCENVTGKSIAYDVLTRRPGDPARLIASAKKAKDKLGWQPERSELKIMVSDAWRWMQRKNG